jgi:hypothetical protein
VTEEPAQPPTKAAPRKRASATRVPPWWLAHVGEVAAASGLSRAELGERLALTVGRSRSWSAMTVWRFLRGEHVTDELADAFQVLFELPPYVFYPRDLADAVAIGALQAQSAATTSPPAFAVPAPRPHRPSDVAA